VARKVGWTLFETRIASAIKRLSGSREAGFRVVGEVLRNMFEKGSLTADGSWIIADELETAAKYVKDVTARYEVEVRRALGRQYEESHRGRST